MAVFLLALLLAADATDTGSRVRSSSATIRLLCQEAEQQSALFSALVAELNQSDVVVYIEPYARLSYGLAGAVNHDVVNRGGVRYVRVLVSPLDGAVRTIGLIAHELQHVVEIARAPEAIDAQSVQHLFQRIGFVRPGHSYETAQAQINERIVLAEIRRARTQTHTVPPPVAGGLRTAPAR
jgi:hypothetical protein